MAQEGTHEQLMARHDGIYCSMSTAQAAQYEATGPVVPRQNRNAPALRVKGGPQ
ncbi:hypothetical protein [Streptomyces candidus]|uniref:Uncharacterized protein n=1 Tax=Streptomyces candidus TaxID=67283 RepID=A0A7X0HLD8_9ACTN|nr:hypothetical protein [Streptomyces candidus]MBB6439691.1 hypothetical protein [Streptomyces candidus]GHH56682.1 hypothetical protein GCM10018773_63000 [Streptomyces candidus]